MHVSDNITGRSTLKTLCPEDKHKVKQLIEDLAKTGAEKDVIEQLLKKERHDFDERLSQLHLEQQNLVEERTSILLSIHYDVVDNLIYYPHDWRGVYMTQNCSYKPLNHIMIR